MPPSSPDAFLQQTFRQLIEIDKGALGNLLLRGHVPFHEKGEGWTEYTYRQAFATRLAVRLGDYLDLVQARSLVENYLDSFVEHFGKELLAGNTIYFGYAKFFASLDDGRAGEGIAKYSSGIVAGELGALCESVIAGAVGDPRIEFVALGSSKSTMRQVCLIDAGYELRRLRDIANDNPKATAWMTEARS
jgi:hypothetical protein